MNSIKQLTLYSYFYSSATWRIRAFLALRKIPFKYEAVHLLDGKQHSDTYLEVNPMHQVPSLKVELNDGQVHVLTQSLAIIQYLDEQYPVGQQIYPKDSLLKAKSQAIADTISGGIQPLQNLETLTRYKESLGIDEPMKPDERKRVAQFWIKRKLANLEKLVVKTAGKYCIGDQLTIADFALVPQMFNARRFELDTSDFPTIKAIDARLQELEIFQVSHPYNCPDTPEELRGKL